VQLKVPTTKLNSQLKLNHNAADFYRTTGRVTQWHKKVIF